MADTIERVRGGHRIRIRYGKGQRQRYTMPLTKPEEAERRAATLRELAAMLTKAGRAAEAPIMLRKAAEARADSVLAEVMAFRRGAVFRLSQGQQSPKAERHGQATGRGVDERQAG